MLLYLEPSRESVILRARQPFATQPSLSAGIKRTKEGLGARFVKQGQRLRGLTLEGERGCVCAISGARQFVSTPLWVI